ncbi:MAG: hypothetical protein R2774_01665 [Saprospiraceae bacterium]
MGNLKIENKWLIFLGIILTFLVSKEAYVLPLTHDEYNTISCSQTSLWDIISYKDPVPNNHILNTLLLKLNIYLFGEHLFTDRLHNVVFFIPYFVFGVKTSRLIFDNIWIRVTMITLLTLHPFLLDFFSVTRGYGISVSLLMISLYFAILQWQHGKTKHLILSALFCAFGVYANFTLINVLIPLMGILAYYTYTRWFSANKSLFYKDLGMIVLINSILGIMVFNPLYKMVSTKQFVYWGTSGIIHDTVKSLIQSMRTGVEYFGTTNERIFAIVFGFIVIVSVVGCIFNLLFQKNKTYNYLYSLLTLVILYNITQFYVLKIPYLNARTALFFIPLVGIVISISVNTIYKRSKTLGIALLILINAAIVQHFVRGFNVKVNQEWYYDANTYEVLDYVKAMVDFGQLPKPVQMNCYWIFYPSLKYHVDHGYSEYITFAPYDTKIDNDQASLIYYTESGEKDKILHRFDVLKDFGWGSRFVMKAKSQ